MASNEAGFSFQVRSDLETIYKDRIHLQLIYNQRQSGKKPYDFYFNLEDHFTAIETKIVKGHTFNFKNDVKQHQPQKLREVMASKGTGIFLICFNHYRCAFVVTPDMMDLLVKENGVAIHYKHFEMYSTTDQIIKICRCKIQGSTRWHVERLIYATQIF